MPPEKRSGMPHDRDGIHLPPRETGPKPGHSAAAWAEGAEDGTESPTPKPARNGMSFADWGCLVAGILLGSFAVGLIAGMLH